MCPRGLSELAPAHTPVASAPTAVIPPSARAAASGVHPRRAPISLSPALLVHLSSPHTATHPLPFHVRATRRSGSSTFSDRSARRATAPRGTPSGTTRGRPTRSHWRRCAFPAPTDALAVVSVRPPCACRGDCGGVRAPTLRRPRRSRWRPCALHAHSIYFFSSPPCRACVFGWRSRAPPDVVALVSRRPPCAGRERIFLLSGLGSLVRWSCVWEYVRVWQCGNVRGYHAVVWLLFVKLGNARLDGGRFFLTQ